LKGKVLYRGGATRKHKRGGLNEKMIFLGNALEGRRGNREVLGGRGTKLQESI